MTPAGGHAATSPRFKDNAKAALADADLQNALKFVEVNFIARRREVADKLPEFEALRDSARDIKDHTLAHLDLYLEAYERRVIEQGGHVHYAVTGEDAQQIILDICRKLGARTVTKGKSMVAEEIGLNDFLEQNGVTSVETDLGEYIIQLRHGIPSHIIAPAVHLTKAQIEGDFRRVHTDLPRDRNLVEPTSLLAEARGVLREKFLAADVGITGANFLVAETGTSVIVTNEGNGDLTQTLPKAHIVLASIEKLVPTLEDLIGIDKAGHLPNASTFCGRCEEVCPVRIPLPRMMRSWREREFERHLSPATVRSGLAFWGFFARRPGLYGFVTAIAARLLAFAGRARGRFTWLPLASGWTRYRDFPAPQGATFQAQWRQRRQAPAKPWRPGPPP